MKRLLLAMAIIASLNACEKEKVTTVDQAAINQANAKLVGAWKDSTVEVHVDSKVFTATLEEIEKGLPNLTIIHDTINFNSDGTFNRMFKVFEGNYTVSDDLKGIIMTFKLKENGINAGLEQKYNLSNNNTLLTLSEEEFAERKENEPRQVEETRGYLENIVKIKGGESDLIAYKNIKKYTTYKKIK